MEVNWILSEEKLPPENHMVLVIVERTINMECGEMKYTSHDIGEIRDKRWRLQSQQSSSLPYAPIVDSNLVTHWMELPEKP